MPATPIDTEELQARADASIEQALPGSRVDPVTPLQGGTSSITYWTTVRGPGNESRKVVLKVAPAGLEPVRNRDVIRQARGSRRWRPPRSRFPRCWPSTTVRRPRSPRSSSCRSRTVTASSPIPCRSNNNCRPMRFGTASRSRPDSRRAARGLVPSDVGLAAEPETPLASELERWVNAFAVCEPDLREGNEAIAELLAATTPPMGATTVLHGDYRLGNTLSRGHEVVSVIDWEIWSRGDARIDLAWFLMMANPDESLGRVTCQGMPGDRELLDTYHQARGAVVEDLTWFSALVRYKQAAAGALIARHARRRGETTTTAQGNAGLLASARSLLS